MLRTSVGAAASDPRLADAALAILERGGTAVDGCVAAFLDAAVAKPGVVLGAASLVTSGPGIGARFFAGAFLQPGRGAPRPRGLRPEDAIPDACRAGVSSAISALYAAHAHDSVLSFSELASSSVRAATAAGLQGRAALLRSIGASGPLATREIGFVRDVLEVAGRAAGGYITETDLLEATAEAGTPNVAGALMSLPPSDRMQVLSVLESAVVCTCDVRGAIAVMHLAFDPMGLEISPHEVTAPRTAIQVQRGVPRVAPGVRLEVPAPIGILLDTQGVPWSGVAFDAMTLAPIAGLVVGRDEGLTLDQVLAAVLARESPQARCAVGVVRGTIPSAKVRVLRLQRAAQM